MSVVTGNSIPKPDLTEHEAAIFHEMEAARLALSNLLATLQAELPLVAPTFSSLDAFQRGDLARKRMIFSGIQQSIHGVDNAIHQFTIHLHEKSAST